MRWISDHVAVVDANFLVPYAKVHDGNQIRFIDVYGRILPARIGRIVKDTYHFITLQSLQLPKPALDQGCNGMGMTFLQVKVVATDL